MVARLLWPEEWRGLGGSQSPRFVLFRSYLISQRAAVLRGFPFLVSLTYLPFFVPLCSHMHFIMLHVYLFEAF